MIVVLSLSKMSTKSKCCSKNLTDLERTGIMCTLLQPTGANMKISRTDFESVALTCACSVKSIMTVWKRGRDTMSHSSDLLDVRSKFMCKKGKERIDSYAVHNKMEYTSYCKQCTLRSFTRVTGVSASTFGECTS